MDANLEKLELQIQSLARGFAYPRTPDLLPTFLSKSAIRPRSARRLAWALAIALVALASLLAVPEVRARLAEFFRIGGIDLTLPNENEGSGLEYTTPEFGEFGTVIPITQLAGETTLAEARVSVDFEIALPSYPSDLGDPDRVFVQELGPGEFVILLWINEDDESQVDLALYVLGPDVRLTKGEPETIEFLRINGQPAALVKGDHFLYWRGGRASNFFGILVQAPALVWEAGELTYRIEADLPLDELVKIAESLPE